MKTKKREINPSSKLFIATAVIAVLTLVTGIVFIYAPFADRNKSLRADILRERDKNILVGKIKALGKHIKVYNKRIPESGGVSWLLGEISNMASKERIEVSSIKPGNPEDYGLYTKLSVVVEIASTYNQLGSFVSGIESSEKFLKVETINIKRMDLDEKFDKGSGKFKAFDVKANIVIST
ncbi:MAG: type 4a pilus biogenesis protein PilO, partial [Candidatus Omnitrophica bacterium]|nr:type 4a pilus biogenesis protein PilO [Candidatus Omnitrophota bacterium]